MTEKDRRFERKVNPNLCGAGDHDWECQKCGADFWSDRKKPCPDCGNEDVREMCPMCGVPINEDMRLCPKCHDHV